MTILSFAASNSSQSINQQLVSYAVSLCKNSRIINLRDYDTPIYSSDLESQDGIPQTIQNLHQVISAHEKLIISIAEHNGNLTAFFKNQIDWLSRHNYKF